MDFDTIAEAPSVKFHGNLSSGSHADTSGQKNTGWTGRS
jgi:hypothetical protein